MEYLTVAEVVERTGISAATVRAMARDQILEAYESGGRWIFPLHVAEALEEQVEAAQEALESGEHEPVEDDDDDDEEEDDVVENPEDNPDDEDDEDDDEDDEDA